MAARCRPKNAKILMQMSDVIQCSSHRDWFQSLTEVVSVVVVVVSIVVLVVLVEMYVAILLHRPPTHGYEPSKMEYLQRNQYGHTLSFSQFMTERTVVKLKSRIASSHHRNNTTTQQPNIHQSSSWESTMLPSILL